MLNVEALKLKLTKLFTSIQYKDYADNLTEDWFSGKLKDGQEKSIDIHIKEFDLFFKLEMKFDKNQSKHYRTISFEKYSDEDIPNQVYSLSPETHSTNKQMITLELEDKKLKYIIGEYRHEIDDEYNFSLQRVSTISEYWFDLSTGTSNVLPDIIFDQEKMAAIRVLSVDISRLKAEIHRESSIDSKFKQMIEDCNIELLLSLPYHHSFLVLKHLFEFNPLKYILNHPEFSTEYIDYITGELTCGLKKPDGRLRDGTNVYEVLGIKKGHEDYFESMNYKGWNELMLFIDLFNRLADGLGISDENEIEQIIDLADGDLTRTEDALVPLIYLYNSGYSLQELRNYAKKAWEYQALEREDTFKLLFYTVFVTELQTGERIKRFPKHLKEDFDVNKQRLYEKTMKKYDSCLNAERNRKSLEGTFDDFNVRVASANKTDIVICGNRDSLVKLLLTQDLIFNFPNYNEKVSVRIIGDSVYFMKEPKGKNHQNLILAYLESHKIVNHENNLTKNLFND